MNHSNNEDDKTCKICDDDYSVSKYNMANMTEWLDVVCECQICNVSACTTCLVTCYDCWNKNIENLVICTNCNSKENMYTNISCKYHQWYRCPKHMIKYKNECTECNANKNYERYGTY